MGAARSSRARYSFSDGVASISEGFAFALEPTLIYLSLMIYPPIPLNEGRESHRKMVNEWALREFGWLAGVIERPTGWPWENCSKMLEWGYVEVWQLYVSEEDVYIYIFNVLFLE